MDINEYVKAEFFEENTTYFGYFENLDNIIFIFAKNKEDTNVDKLSKNIVSFLANSCMQLKEYTLKNLEIVITNAKMYLKENKFEDLDSVCIISTDLITYNAIILGNISLRHISNNKLKFETMGNSTCFGGSTDIIKGYRLKENELLQGDKLLLVHNNITKLAIQILKIKQNIAKKNIKKVDKKSLIIIFIFLFSIIYICINTFRINRYDRILNSINNDLEIYVKNIEVQNISIEISNLEKVYSQIEGTRFLIFPKKRELKYKKNKFRLKEIKEDIEAINDIKEKNILAKECVNKEDFNLAKDIYTKILKSKTNILNIKNLKDEALKNISMVKNLENIDELKIKADELYKDFKIKKAKDLYEKIFKIYKTYNKNTEFIENIIKECDEKIENINEKLNLLIIESEIQSSKDTSRTMNLYKEILKNYEALDDELNIENFNKKMSNLKDTINMYKTQAISLREEAYNYADNKNYKNSIECMLESNKLFKIIRLENELELNNKHIRKIKNIMRTEYRRVNENTKNNRKDIKRSVNKNQIIRSINLSISKGDSFVREDKYNEAIIEYKRALDFCNEISYTGENVEKLKKKLVYVIKKTNKNNLWSNIWK